VVAVLQLVQEVVKVPRLVQMLPVVLEELHQVAPAVL